MKAILLSLCLLFAISSSSQSTVVAQIDSLNLEAVNFYKKNQIISAFNQLNHTKRLADSIGYFKGKAFSSNQLGLIYALMRENLSAEESYTDMLEAAQADSDSYLIAKAYLNLAISKKRNGSEETVIKYFNQAITYIEESYNAPGSDKKSKRSNNLIIKTYINFANFHLENNNLKHAYDNIIKAEGIMSQIDENNIKQLAGFNSSYGLYFFKKKLYNIAIVKFNKALSYLDGDQCSTGANCQFLSLIHENLSLCYSALGNKTLAYSSLLQYYKYKENFLFKEKNKQINLEKSRFLVENYKNKILLANNEKLYQKEIAEKIKSINYVIIWALILLIICLVILFRSYTSKRTLTSVLKTQNRELELVKNEALKSSEMKSNFISNVSHELRTPLYGVVGLTSIMLENNSLGDRDLKYLKSLKYSGDYLLNLINDILHVGKIESKIIDLNNTPVNLKNLIENVTESFDYSLEESNNKMQILVDKDIPESIMCDKLRLTQVLFNLIGNSIKFTQNGTIYVKAILNKKEQENVFLRFEVSDNGSGIPEEKQASIFESFTQLSENANTNYQGAGLGLSIASQIVNLFGSKIDLESKVGCGSTFAFNVRFVIDAEGIDQIRKNKLLKSKCDKEVSRIKILVVEDNKINQIVTSNLLKKQNIDFDMVENGQEALDAFTASSGNNYDLILMDLHMPVMDGYEATFRIKSINKSVPVVALTASSPDDLKSNKYLVKFDDIITKPFDNELFFCKIMQLVSRNKVDSFSKDATNFHA